MIKQMVESGISYRRQSQIMGIPHQTLHARATTHESVPCIRSTGSEEHYLADCVQSVETAHPSWGIRRVRAFIRKKNGIRVGRKRIARIMRSRNLLCSRIKNAFINIQLHA
jgi:transposase InsO family protein